jgi:RNA polymerase sigma-70 factor (ECF subfamily)
MVETPESNREEPSAPFPGAGMGSPEVKAWFLREVLPLESLLMQFLRHNWREQGDVEDILHDVYIRVFEAACRQIPEQTKPFVFTTARNLLISSVRKRQVIPIEAVADLDALGIAMDSPGPDRSAIARDELRRLQNAIDKLPPRLREALILRRVEGLSRGEIAQRMNVSEATVSAYLMDGMYALADLFYAAPAEAGKP